MGISIKIDNFIYPYFVLDGKKKKQAIKSFPGAYRFSIDTLLGDIEKTKKLGINKILLFGVPNRKDTLGSAAFDNENIVAKAIKRIKTEFPGIVVITDICLCAYTIHGHCGVLKEGIKRGIDNKKTLAALSKIALTHASAGADWVAPSAMANKQVLAIRRSLDSEGFRAIKILGYSAKFASNFYGPFRNAANSAPKFGDRSAYQLDYADEKNALAEIKQDIEEGADVVMVKPALSYLDIIKSAKQSFKHPLAAYNTSGEYAFVKYGVRQGLWDEKKIVTEIITSIKRAGADFIITYHAKEITKWQKE